MHLAIKVENYWTRCVTKNNPQYCRNIDTGETLNFSNMKSNVKIYELEICFLSLPARAILCDLSGIIPTSSKGARWTNRACQIFHQLTKHKPLLAYFVQKGLLPDSFYLFLSSVNKDETKIHLNTVLCGFDTAVVYVVGLHHPIWPDDKPLLG